MKRWGNLLGLSSCLAMAIAALVSFTGCADDLYAPCDLDPTSPDEAVSRCASDPANEEQTCAVKNQVQCDSRICARYSGSDPFCTEPCTADGDCPSGRCLEIPFQSGEKFCVEQGNVN